MSVWMYTLVRLWNLDRITYNLENDNSNATAASFRVDSNTTKPDWILQRDVTTGSQYDSSCVCNAHSTCLVRKCNVRRHASEVTRSIRKLRIWMFRALTQSHAELLRGGTLMPIGILPQMLTQRLLVCGWTLRRESGVHLVQGRDPLVQGKHRWL